MASYSFGVCFSFIFLLFSADADADIFQRSDQCAVLPGAGSDLHRQVRQVPQLLHWHQPYRVC